MSIIVRFRNKLYRRLNLSSVYETSVGVKYTNPMLPTIDYVPVVSNIPIILQSKDLLLYEDFLKDKYSLICTPLIESPHIEFLGRIRDHKDILDCDYVKRVKSGCLDARDRSSFGERQINLALSLYGLRYKQVIVEDDYKPIFLLHIDGNYYIYDGKHRAAMCALYEQPIRCLILASAMVLRKTWLYNPMLKCPEQYSKHISLMKRLYETENCVER